ncbi:MAG TPA: MotA/TolQ/ExbB proton channel family protein [Rhodothermales bacterium]
MEKATVLGIVAGFGLVYGAIFLGDGWQTFFDLPSAILVLGGTASALVVNFSFTELRSIPQHIRSYFGHQEPDLAACVHTFHELSRVARREGLLALDRRVSEIEDEFMRFGLEMAVDGIDEREIDDLMVDRIKVELAGKQVPQRFFTSAGTYAPAFGMVGTLIGLIQMLQNLDDPAQIGSGMAVALITTFYGALLANLICLPMASKFKTQANDVARARRLAHMGVMAIVRGESPSMVEKRLRLYLNGEDPTRVGPTETAELSRAA